MNESKLLLAAIGAAGIGALWGLGIHPVPLEHAGEDWRSRYPAPAQTQAPQDSADFVQYGSSPEWLYGLVHRAEAEFADTASLPLVEPPPPASYRLEQPIATYDDPALERRIAEYAVEDAMNRTASVDPQPEASPSLETSPAPKTSPSPAAEPSPTTEASPSPTPEQQASLDY